MPEANLSASNMIITLIIRRKSPNVISVRGRVKTTSNGSTMKLRIANTSAKITAVVNNCITTCGANTFERTYTTIAV